MKNENKINKKDLIKKIMKYVCFAFLSIWLLLFGILPLFNVKLIPCKATVYASVNPPEEVEQLTPIESFTLELRGSTYWIMGFVGTETDIVVPTTYNDTPITTVGSQAFKSSNITSISGSSIGTLCWGAFSGCTKLSNVNLPLITRLPSDVFYGCSALTNLILGNVTFIGPENFYNCTSLTDAPLLTATEIGSNAFENCTGLTEITINDNCTYIGNEAFKGCSNIVSFHISYATMLKCFAGLNSVDTSVFNISNLPSSGGSSGATVKEYTCPTCNGSKYVLENVMPHVGDDLTGKYCVFDDATNYLDAQEELFVTTLVTFNNGYSVVYVPGNNYLQLTDSEDHFIDYGDYFVFSTNTSDSYIISMIHKSFKFKIYALCSNCNGTGVVNVEDGTISQEELDALLDDAYNNGFSSGKASVDTDSFLSYGYLLGLNDGEKRGLNASLDLKNIVFAIFDAPFNVIRTIFDVTIFGVNLSAIILAITSLLLVGFLWKKLK